MPVPFLDLRRQTIAAQDSLDGAVERVFERGRFILGPELSEFEDEFAAWCGSTIAIGVGSGTDAIEIALRALGIGAGDEVITQANTCVPTIAAIERAGATPVLCDVELETASIDPTSVAQAVGPRTRAIVPVHLYGRAADIAGIEAVANGIPIIEDCAQAHGTKLNGRRAGSIGRIGAFSFYPSKNLGAVGDAGALVTDDDELAARIRKLRAYGQSDLYQHDFPGVNSRLDEVQAAVLREKLLLLDSWVDRRQAIAESYFTSLADASVRLLPTADGTDHAFHLFVVRSSDRDALRSGLEKRGVGTLVHYPLAIHQQPAYQELGNSPVSLTNAEILCSQVASLPLYPELTDTEVTEVIEAVQEAAAVIEPIPD